MVTFSAVIQLINQIIPLVIGLAKLYKEAKLKGWINDGVSLQLKINEAKTDEERMALAKSIFNHRAE